MDKHTIELTRSQWMALTALVAQHLQCQERLDEYVDCRQEPEVMTRPEELLAPLRTKRSQTTPASQRSLDQKAGSRHMKKVTKLREHLSRST
jgi:hypothetical protein